MQDSTSCLTSCLSTELSWSCSNNEQLIICTQDGKLFPNIWEWDKTHSERFNNHSDCAWSENPAQVVPSLLQTRSSTRVEHLHRLDCRQVTKHSPTLYSHTMNHSIHERFRDYLVNCPIPDSCLVLSFSTPEDEVRVNARVYLDQKEDCSFNNSIFRTISQDGVSHTDCISIIHLTDDDTQGSFQVPTTCTRNEWSTHLSLKDMD